MTTRLGILGAGQMGAGIAQVAAAAGVPVMGRSTENCGCHIPFSSKFAKIGARWLIVPWQLAQMIDLSSWKSILAFLLFSLPVIDP